MEFGLAVSELSGRTGALLSNASFLGSLWVPGAIVFCSRILGCPSKGGVVFQIILYMSHFCYELVDSIASSPYFISVSPLSGLLHSALKFVCPDRPSQRMNIILETLPICNQPGILPNIVSGFAQSHED